MYCILQTQIILKMFKKVIITTILGFIITINQGQAQAKYKVYAGFMNHFTKYVQWPADTKSGDFVIAVVGNSPIITELKPLEGKMVGAQKIVIKAFATAGAVTSGHIIFVSEAQGAGIGDVSKKAKSFNSLVVAEIPGGAGKGADINFIEADGKIKFEVSSSNPDAHGIKISAELKKLGIAVD